MAKPDDEQSFGRISEELLDRDETHIRLGINRYTVEASTLQIPAGEVPPRTIVVSRRDGSELWLRAGYMSQNVNGDIAFWKYFDWTGDWILVVLND